ncbi:hypothetical protein [Larkinella rosea]|uniref:Gliding motility-associated C-terminal domain-containing protein n=1 Tax=Larkinella rosea TaxID=2025312 RepID=A0A3P1BPK0_9BACT|nr:hypothetical protein [Larkinella rosea]RRB02843.1 hypothetical protein EHT25_20610 [Larkinella rosea]
MKTRLPISILFIFLLTSFSALASSENKLPIWPTRYTGLADQPTVAAIEEALAKGTLVEVTNLEISDAFVEKALTQLPLTLRVSKPEAGTGRTVQYDLTILGITVTTDGIKFTLGAKFIIPGTDKALYFGGSDIPMSFKGGAFSGAINLIDGGSTTDLGMGPNARFTLGPQTQLQFSCGKFSGISLDGELTVSHNSLLAQGIKNIIEKDFLVNTGTDNTSAGEYRFHFNTGVKDQWISIINLDTPSLWGIGSGNSDEVGQWFEKSPQTSTFTLDLSHKLITVKKNNPCDPLPSGPVLTAVDNRTSIGVGESVDLNASGCENSTLEWQGGPPDSGFWRVNPSVTTTYRARCKRSNDCMSGWSEITINVIAPPVLCDPIPSGPVLTAVDNRTSIPIGESVDLNASSCENSTLEWQGGPPDSGFWRVNPSVTTTYRARCKRSNDCVSGWVEITINIINAPPPCDPNLSAPVLTAEQPRIANGSSTNLTVSACVVGYLEWEGGDPGSSVSPAQTTTYRVRCKQSDACVSGWAETTVVVEGGSCDPNLTAPVLTAEQPRIANGSSTNLTVSACVVGYLEWEGGDPGASVRPAQTTTYRVRCRQSDACVSGWSETTVVVEGGSCDPNLTAPVLTAEQPRIANGSSTNLTVSACVVGYLEWEGGDPGMRVSPAQTTTYRVRCKQSDDCVSGWAETTVEVEGGSCDPNLTAPVLIAEQPRIANGSSTNLTVSACVVGYLEWEGGDPGMRVSPAQTTTYRVRCKQSDACVSGWAETTVVVEGGSCDPNLTAPALIAEQPRIANGSSTNLTVSACVVGYLEWEGGDPGSSVRPAQTTTYRVRCRQSEECVSGWAETTVVVEGGSCDPNLTAPALTAEQPRIANGSSTNLTVSACVVGYLEWEGGDPGMRVSPAQTTTYRVRCKQSDDCVSGWAETTVEVEGGSCDPNLTAPVLIAEQPRIANGSSTNLTVSACVVGYLEWEGGDPGMRVSPAQTTTYRVRCKQSDACVSGWAETTVVVEGGSCDPNLTAPVLTAEQPRIANGSSTNLTVSACLVGYLEWEGGDPGSRVSPAQTTTYKVRCRQSDACVSGWAETTVEVHDGCNVPKPAVWADPASILAGGSSTLHASGCAGTLKWEGGPSGGDWPVSPSGTTTYQVYCVEGPCQSERVEVTVTVGVEPTPCDPPILTASDGRTRIQKGESIQLIASACNGQLVWDDDVIDASRSVSPENTTTYRVYCERNGCSASTELTIFVDSAPTRPLATRSSGPQFGTSANCDANQNYPMNYYSSDGQLYSGITLYISNQIANENHPPSAFYTLSDGRWMHVGENGVVDQLQSCSISPPPCIPPSAPILYSYAPQTTKGITMNLYSDGCGSSTFEWDNGSTQISRYVTPDVTTIYRARCKVMNAVPECASEWAEIKIIVVEPCTTPPAAPQLHSPGKEMPRGEPAGMWLYSDGCTNSDFEWEDGTAEASRMVSPQETTTYRARCKASDKCYSDWAEITITIVDVPQPPTTPTTPVTPNPDPPVVYTRPFAVQTSGPQFGSGANCDPGQNFPMAFYSSDGQLYSGVTLFISNDLSNENHPSSAYYTLSDNRWMHVNGAGEVDHLEVCSVSPPPPPPPPPCNPSIPYVWADHSNIVAGGSAWLQAIGCNGTLEWEGGHSGSDWTVSPTQTTTYRVLCKISGICSSDWSTITITVEPPVIVGPPSLPSTPAKTVQEIVGLSASYSTSEQACFIYDPGNINKLYSTGYGLVENIDAYSDDKGMTPLPDGYYKISGSTSWIHIVGGRLVEKGECQ